MKASPLVNRQLNEKEKANYHENLRTALIALHMGSADKKVTDSLGTILGYGYVLAVNFLEEQNLQEVFKEGIRSLFRARCAIDARKRASEADLSRIEAAGQAAIAVLSEMDLFSLGRMEKIFRVSGQKIIDGCLEELGGNERPKKNVLALRRAVAGVRFANGE